jgi:hypothetical protein
VHQQTQRLPLINLPSNWDEVGERQLVGPEIIQDTKDKITLIRKRMLAAQSHQKSYTDTRRRKLEFEVGDQVFLKVTNEGSHAVR